MATRDTPSTPGEIRALSEEIPHQSPVSCMECGEEWECGHEFVEEGLRHLHQEYIRLEQLSDADDMALRFALEWLAHTSVRLLPEDDFEIVTRCPVCRLKRAKEKGADYAAGAAPRDRSR